MEDEKMEYTSYYDVKYFDDNNTSHLTKILDKQTLDFYKERFKITSCNYVNV